MSEKVELKRKYVKLMQDGKKDEARVILKQIWDFGKEKPVNVTKRIEVVDEVEEKLISKPIKKKSKKKEQRVQNRFETINDLSKINGIGKETIKDLNSLYSCLDDLINDITNGKFIPLRNDIEIKLRKELL